jgi:hypothetical protein
MDGFLREQYKIALHYSTLFSLLNAPDLFAS